MTTITSLPEQIVASIRSVVGSNKAALHEPSFIGNEWNYLKECLDSTFVSSTGKFVDRFESDLASFTGAKHVIAVVNGTAALHLALKLAGVKPNEEVLIPSLTFVATANAVAYCGAIPHFVDSCMPTMGLDAEKLRIYLAECTEQRSGHCINRATGRVIRAIVPMHAFGHPVDLEGLISITHDFALVMVEDAAESLGSYYDGQHTGTFGRMGILSFNGNKTVTCGGGGAILTNNSELAHYAKHLSTTAKLPHVWEYKHDEIGYNYRLPNLNAALGCAQLEQLPAMLAAKRKLFLSYKAAFTSVAGVKLVSEPERCQSNYWLNTLLLDAMTTAERDVVLRVTNDAGFMTRPAWILMHKLRPFEACPRMDLTNAQSLSECLITIPSSARLICE